MRIGMLLMGGVYPPDIRVEKEAKVLARAGHQVFLLASDKRGGARRERVGDIEVVRYRAKAGWLASKTAALSTFATWRNPLWERAIESYAREIEADALHVHDLPAVASALAVGRRLGIPVTYDMHENYPAAVGYWPRSRAAKLFQTPKRYDAYERSAVTGVDRVVTVVDESAERVRALGAKPERVVVFGNVDDAEGLQPWEGPREPFTAAYAGGFGPHRGLEVLVRALPLLRERVPGARVVLMGAGEGESRLRELATALKVADAVEFTGWVDAEEMRRRLREASVGAVPHLRNAHTDSTIPHKLFQYMAMGLPVVVTDCAPLARIVDETHAGWVARSGDAEDLARALAEAADPEAARRASEAGREAVERRYNLVREGESLVELYAGLAKERA